MADKKIYDEASKAIAVPEGVKIDGPGSTDLTMTPAAALETAKRIGDAAIDALLHVETVTEPPKPE